MSSKECEEQLKSLIEHFKNGGLDFNATDIKAIEHLLLENKTQQDTIKEQKQKNKELHNKIDRAIEFIKKVQFDEELKSYVYGLNATGTRKLLKILKDSDVDE